MSMPIAWTIAGSDPTAGAGIQTDLQVFNQLGVHGCSVITAVTAQNSHGVSMPGHLSHELILAQISALKTEFPARAIKTGMLGTAEIIDVLDDFFAEFSGKIVMDPVLISSSGGALFSSKIDNYLQKFQQIFTKIYLLTPNIPEAILLTGRQIHTHEDMQKTATDLLKTGVKNVLIKGGHLENSDHSSDYFTNGSESFWLVSERRPHAKIRGTGCAFSSAVTACLALNFDIKDALVIAKMYVNKGIRLAKKAGGNAVHLTHSGWPEEGVDMPFLQQKPGHTFAHAFPDCGTEPLGLYPVVDNIEWLKKLMPLSVNTIQLRIKNKSGDTLEDEIKDAIALAKKFNARLFINDYWQLAIKHGAYGVHLGQEDLCDADVSQIHTASLRLGISTHCYYEVARAHAYKPSYIACGPIYPTTSKIMPFAAQGITNLQRWQRTLAKYPLVAIGGINHNNIDDVLSTNVSGIAMISAITQAENPIESAKKLMKMAAQSWMS